MGSKDKQIGVPSGNVRRTITLLEGQAIARSVSSVNEEPQFTSELPQSIGEAASAPATNVQSSQSPDSIDDMKNVARSYLLYARSGANEAKDVAEELKSLLNKATDEQRPVLQRALLDVTSVALAYVMAANYFTYAAQTGDARQVSLASRAFGEADAMVETLNSASALVLEFSTPNAESIAARFTTM